MSITQMTEQTVWKIQIFGTNKMTILRGDNMYVIGKTNKSFIRIKLRTMLDDMYNIDDEIYHVVYDCRLEAATIVDDYDEAKQILDEIQNRIDEINFSNICFVGQLVDEEDGFNKVDYAKELKIFSLVPTLVDDFRR